MFEIGHQVLVEAVRNSFSFCGDYEEMVVCGNTVIEFLTSVGLTDKEVISVLKDSSGYCVEVDDFIEVMIKNVES